MPRRENEATTEGKKFIPLYVLPGGLSLEDLRRIWWETWDEVREGNGLKKLEKPWEMRATDQRVASQELDARQPRLAMEADGPANTKTHERTEGAATAVQAMHGNSCSADQVDLGPMCSTSSGDDCTGPPAPPCSGENAVVENRAAAPKSFLLSLEMRSPTTAGGLVPTGEISTVTKTTYNETPLRLYATVTTNPKEKKLTTSISSASYDSSFWKLLAAPSCLRVIEAKSMQNRTLDPGGS